jgi:hypothetical protein
VVEAKESNMTVQMLFARNVVIGSAILGPLRDVSIAIMKSAEATGLGPPALPIKD